MTERLQEQTPAFWTEKPGPRLPRIALMGEFSAGKSTLANMMIGSNPLPVQVVATQLPPVWIVYGDMPSVLVGLDGTQTPCDFETLQGIEPEEIAFIRIHSTEEILKQCEIIDMPGISDPNMPNAVWERILPFADGVLWCSPATQAWRQSEAAVWADVDETVKKNSLLVLTRGDMLLTDKDKSKVIKRVRSEAGDLFTNILMISLALARDAGDDDEIWAHSGADEFVARFLELVQNIADELTGAGAPSKAPGLMVDNPEQEVDIGAKSEGASVLPRRPVMRKKTVATDKKEDNATPDPMSFMPKFS